jgi:hypothetical protein
MRNSRSIPGAVKDGLRGIVSRIPYTPLALRRQGREFLAAGNVPMANQVADRLTQIDPCRGTHFRGEILLHLQPHNDHTEFWAEAASKFPADANFARKTIHAALKAGKVETAEAGFSRLMKRRHTRARDSNYVIGLANIYSSRADDAKIRLIVRQFMRSLRGRPDHGIAAVRLSRLIFSYFPRDRSTVGRNGGRTDKRFLAMLERSSVMPKPKSILRRVVALESALASTAPMALFDTDISEAQCRKFVSLVTDRLESGGTFSFVRVGDGESSCLPCEPRLSEFAPADTADRERTWWGTELGASDRARISEQVASAIWNADCIGIPTVSRFLRDTKLHEDDGLDGGRTGRGLRSILYTFENVERFRPRNFVIQRFASCHLHQDLARWDLYQELFGRSKEVVLVSCHPGLADVVQQRFGVHVAGSILVPPRHASLPLLREKPVASGPLPDVIGFVAERLGDLPRNRLVLVGAGYLGKWLVDLAKTRGGVALDLGSIFDHWMGINTRSYQDLAPK